MPGCNSSAPADDERIAVAARCVAAGGVVVYPTETVYGLGVAAGDGTALQRLVDLKVRIPGKPIAVLISDADMLERVVTCVSPIASMLMRRFWPGPLTLILPARAAVSPLLTGDNGGIGVRISSHPMATELVRAAGQPITAPSANPAGRPPPRGIAAARAYFGAQVDYYLDGGALRGEPASTVVDVRGQPRLLRAGAIAAAELCAIVPQLEQ